MADIKAVKTFDGHSLFTISPIGNYKINEFSKPPSCTIWKVLPSQTISSHQDNNFFPIFHFDCFEIRRPRSKQGTTKAKMETDRPNRLLPPNTLPRPLRLRHRIPAGHHGLFTRAQENGIEIVGYHFSRRRMHFHRGQRGRDGGS